MIFFAWNVTKRFVAVSATTLATAPGTACVALYRDSAFARPTLPVAAVRTARQIASGSLVQSMAHLFTTSILDLFCALVLA